MKESYHTVCIDFSLRGGTAILKTSKTETSMELSGYRKPLRNCWYSKQKLKEFIGSVYNDYNLVVIALDNGNLVKSRIVRDGFQKLCEENDYEIVVFHSLRHLSTG